MNVNRVESNLVPTAENCPIVTDQRSAHLAHEYAEQFIGRTVNKLDNLREIDTPNIFLVCEPHNLRRPVLDLLTTQFQGIVGVATGRSTEKLDGFLQRQISPHCQPTNDSGLLFDELYSQVFHLSKQSQRLYEYPKKISRTSLFKQRSWLGLHVHGEGAHGNLRSLVLCGQSELGSKLENGGCTDLKCKRSSHTDGKFHSFREITSSQVMFLSCSGLSVGKEHYPSANSAALSLIDSPYVRTVICNDRTVPLSSEEARIAFQLAVSEGAVAACQYLNSVSSPRHSGAHPWLMLGDPAMAHTPSFDRRLIGRRELAGHTGRLVSVRGLGTAAISATSTELLHELKTDGTLTLYDETDRVRKLQKELQDALSLNLFGALFIDALIDGIPGTSEAADSLHRLNTEVRTGLRLALQSAKNWETARVVAEETAAWTLRCDQLVRLAGRAFARELVPFLDQSIEEIVTRICVFNDEMPGPKCQRCGSNVTRRIGHALYSNSPVITTENCPTCGPIRTLIGETSPPRPQFLHVLEENRLSLSYPATIQDAWCAVSMRDKALGTNVLRYGPEQMSELGPEIPLNDRVSNDLHTVRVLIVSSTSLCIDRLRVAKLV